VGDVTNLIAAGQPGADKGQANAKPRFRERRWLDRERLAPGTGVLLTRLRRAPRHNHADAVSPHSMHNDFARPQKTLTKKCRKPTTPAMAAGLAQHPWAVFQIAELLD
jgi:hypothetical protein